MKKPLEIFGSAQAFGFGGITELMALESAFRLDPRGKDANIYIVKNKQLDAVLQDISGRFNFLPEQIGTQPYLGYLFKRPELGQLDAVVSSYDTASVFYGWYKNIPVYLYDGMVWFWNFDDHEIKIQTQLEKLGRMKEENDESSFIQLYETLAREDYHSTILLAYHLASRIYARNGHNVQKRIAHFSHLSDKTKIIGAMIDPSRGMAEDERKEHVLVSLSGSLAPTLRFEDNLIFARGAFAFAKEAQTEMALGVPWIFCCHPQIYDALQAEGHFDNLPPNFTVRPSMSYAENLHMISRASALFVSPGFSSVQEAASFRTPVFFLPEQNGGQPKGFSTLKDAGYPTENNLTVTDHINCGQIKIGESNTRELYEGVSRLWNFEMQHVRLAVLRRFRNVLSNDGTRMDLVEKQREAIERLMGDFNGAVSVVTDILDHLTTINE